MTKNVENWWIWLIRDVQEFFVLYLQCLSLKLFQNKNIKANQQSSRYWEKVRKQKTSNNQHTRARTPTPCVSGCVAPSVTRRTMWINRSLKTRLLGDYSNQRQNSWRGKKKNGIKNKGSAEPPDFTGLLCSLEGPGLGRKQDVEGQLLLSSACLLLLPVPVTLLLSPHPSSALVFQLVVCLLVVFFYFSPPLS